MRFIGWSLVALVGLYLAVGWLVYLRDSAISRGGTSVFDTPATPINYSQSFDETGTLVYFQEGTGRLNAYLMYQVASSTRSKILNITSGTMCDIRAFRGCPGSAAALRAAVGDGPVRVSGSFRNEELYADTLTY